MIKTASSMRLQKTKVLFAVGLAVGAFCATLLANEDEYGRRASWEIDGGKAVAEKCLAWLETQEVDEATRLRIENSLQEANDATPDEISRRLLEAVSLVDDRVQELISICSRPRTAAELTDIVLLQDESLPEWLRHNLRLHYGIWLANQALYDESHAQLALAKLEEVADPASLLFYRALVQHRRLDKDACLDSIEKLLENEEMIPKRYSTVAKLMQADIAPLKPDSLDEISRLMDSIKVRLGHGRAGTRVRKEEDDVIAKLDKLIEKLEDQAQSSSSSSASQGGSSPSQPMQDSTPGGVQGPGNVDPRSLGADTNWGDLPPKEREEALQQLGRDLPSHYRDVIEQYFRKLSQEEN